MLDYKLSISVSDEAWDSATAQASLIKLSDDFFSEQGAAPMIDDSRRRYHRVRARGRALAIRGKKHYGVLTNDISPMGIGFFAPIQLLPIERIILVFEQSDQIELEIRRCIRTEGTTYSCGGNFTVGPLSPAAYRRFLRELMS